MADDLPDDWPEDWDDNPEWDDTNSVPLTVCGMVAVARARLGVSQEIMADLLEVPVSTLRDWEERRSEPEGPARALIRLLHDHPAEIRDWLSAA